MKEIKGVKLITKIIVSSIIVFLFCFLCFEVAYNKMLHKDYSETHNEMLKAENRVDKLIEINKKLQNYIITINS